MKRTKNVIPEETEELALEMAEGYRAEAEAPSLPEEWVSVELDGWS